MNVTNCRRILNNSFLLGEILIFMDHKELLIVVCSHSLFQTSEQKCNIFWKLRLDIFSTCYLCKACKTMTRKPPNSRILVNIFRCAFCGGTNLSLLAPAAAMERYPKKCKWKGCGTFPYNYLIHVDRLCPYRIVKCPNWIRGCNAEFKVIGNMLHHCLFMP